MPPVSSPRVLDGHEAPARSSAADRAARVRFRRALALMAMTLVAPGSAQLSAGNRRVGRLALRVWLAVVAVTLLTGLVVLIDPEKAVTLGSKAWLLLVVRTALLAGAVGWAVLFMDAWRLGQPLSLGLAHRRAAVGVNGVLSLSVAGSLLFGAHLVGVQRDLIVTMFGSSEVAGSADGRFNVLLMGGDSGAGRWGLRPDSLTVASIDATTGRTVLVSLPRNMQDFPFAEGSVMAEQFPDGFDADYLNGVSTWAQDNAELFGDSDEDPGVQATVSAVEGITGLEVSYWAMVNLQGFKDLVDAVGGVTLTVRQPIPVGGLGSDDYSRMARQKCVMNAMLQQVSPQSALQNFEKIAQASSEMISTNLPASELDRFMSLAMKAKEQKMSSLSLVPPMINTADPDIDLVQRKVAAAIEKAEGSAAPKAKPKSKPDSTSAVTGGSVGSLAEGYAANQAGDLSGAC